MTKLQRLTQKWLEVHLSMTDQEWAAASERREAETEIAPLLRQYVSGTRGWRVPMPSDPVWCLADMGVTQEEVDHLREKGLIDDAWLKEWQHAPSVMHFSVDGPSRHEGPPMTVEELKPLARLLLGGHRANESDDEQTTEGSP